MSYGEMGPVPPTPCNLIVISRAMRFRMGVVHCMIALPIILFWCHALQGGNPRWRNVRSAYTLSRVGRG